VKECRQKEAERQERERGKRQKREAEYLPETQAVREGNRETLQERDPERGERGVSVHNQKRREVHLRNLQGEVREREKIQRGSE